MRKKSIILLIVLLCIALGAVCYAKRMKEIEENIHFIKEDSTREILWGESLAEKDFVELDSSVKDATVLFHYDDSIIKYTGPAKIEGDPNFRLSDYLQVYDIRPYDKVKFDLHEKDGSNKQSYYEYSCDENNQTCNFDQDAVGIHNVHIFAYDGHGNEAYKTIKITVTPPAIIEYLDIKISLEF